MIGWKRDKLWSDRFLPEIKMILGLHLIGEPSREEDAERNTDLIVLRMEAVRISVRVRTYPYLIDYPHDFTIRSGRRQNKTELAKIMEGWGDYFFYGFSDRSETNLAKWRLSDLQVFRDWFIEKQLATGLTPGIVRQNHDGSSVFRVFSYDDFPPQFVVAQGISDSQLRAEIEQLCFG